jgi:hypothetical protein
LDWSEVKVQLNTVFFSEFDNRTLNILNTTLDDILDYNEKRKLLVARAIQLRSDNNKLNDQLKILIKEHKKLENINPRTDDINDQIKFSEDIINKLVKVRTDKETEHVNTESRLIHIHTDLKTLIDNFWRIDNILLIFGGRHYEDEDEYEYEDEDDYYGGLEFISIFDNTNKSYNNSKIYSILSFINNNKILCFTVVIVVILLIILCIIIIKKNNTQIENIRPYTNIYLDSCT